MMFGRFRGNTGNGRQEDAKLHEERIAAESAVELEDDEFLLEDDDPFDPHDEDEEFEWLESEDDPLVRRLRNLKWPEVRPELRERCWKAICEKVEQQQAERERAAQEEAEQQQRQATGEADAV